MARSTGADSQTQQSLKEQIIKEETTALNFFIRNIDKFTAKSGASVVLQKKLEELRVDASRCNKLAKEAEQRAREKQLNKEEIKDRKSELISAKKLSQVLDMRPASPRTKALLYDGISHDGHGRKQYLDVRYRTRPEDKFPFPLPCSWDYGWRLSDSINKDSIRKAPFGRVSIVENTFFTRTGISLGEKTEPKPWYA